MKPIVAIVGRPNTGKSTLFNRITRSRNALVDDAPGVTRDRHYGDARWNDTEFTLIDTGGYMEQDPDGFADQIRFQVTEAVAEAQAVILLLDGRLGISPFDRDLIQILRQSEKPVFFAVNKIDGLEKEEQAFEFYGLGIETFFPISAAHGYGVPDLLDELVKQVGQYGAPAEAEQAIRVAIVGRPNVGKSSLINRLLGQERLVVSPAPGTTRDAIDTPLELNGRRYNLIDTAGIRRKGRVSERLEKFSIIKALGCLERCDVALVLMDAAEGISEQDIRIAGYAHERGCGIILLLNKWDLAAKENLRPALFYEKLKDQAKFAVFAPALTISALTGLRVNKIFPMVEAVYGQYCERIGTGQLNKILEQATTRTPPPLYRGKRLRLFYATQAAAKPPTFICFVNYPEGFHFSYQRYLVNQIRSATRLDKTPIRLFFRQRKRKEK